MRILVTGATGNVGGAVLRALRGSGHDVYAGVRDVDAARARLGEGHRYAHVDFATAAVPRETFDAVFIVRPPALARPEPFVEFVRRLRPVDRALGIRVVFLSVEGVDRQPWLPHARIEKAIAGLDVSHVFVRSGYFMENLLTTLADGIRRHGAIRLPAGDLGFDWVAVDDVAAVIAKSLTGEVASARVHVGNVRLHDFAEVVRIIRDACGTTPAYASPSLPGFVAGSLRDGRGAGFTAIMLLLHWLPRHVRRLRPRADPADVRRVLGREPRSLEDWAAEHCAELRELLS